MSGVSTCAGDDASLMLFAVVGVAEAEGSAIEILFADTRIWGPREVPAQALL